MRRCWRSSPPTTSRMFLRSSTWQTSVPRLWRVMPGTPQSPRRQRGRASPTSGHKPKAATTATATTRRRLAATSHWPEHPRPHLQRWEGAMASRKVINAPVSHPIVTTAAQSASCTTPRAIARRSTGGSRSSQNNSVKRCSSSAKMAHLPASGRASKRWTHRRRKTQRWSSRMPRGH
jgi:hypothetical protein